MKAILCSILILGIASLLSAQSIERQVIASAGKAVTNGSISLDFTVGEVAVTTLSSGSMLLTQGFHQGEFMTTSVSGLPTSVSYKIYPNPAQERLRLEILGPELNFYVLLYNELGQSLSLTKREVQGFGQWQGDFDLSKLSTGMYLVVFTNLQGEWLASHKVIKQ